jgi:hypothetical protein
MNQSTSYTVRIHQEEGQQPWAAVVQILVTC